MEIVPIFPIAFYKVNLRDVIDQKEIDLITRENEKDVYGNENKNFSSSNTYILNDKLNLTQVIQNHVGEYSRQILSLNEDDVRLRITQSWLNFNPKDSSHHLHSHANSILSGVFYIDCDDNTGKFYIKNPNIDRFFVERERYNQYTYRELWFKPEKYDLYLFPSNLYHNVDKNTSDKTRISLAFNTFYSGTIGTKNSLTELII